MVDDIRPNQLPSAILPLREADQIIVDQGTDGVRKAAPIEAVNSVAPVATQSDAVTGTDNVKRMTALRTKQSIASEVGITLASNSQGSKADSAVQSVNGKSGNAVTLVKGDVGLGNVDNTSDVNKPVSTATQAALDLKANSSVTISAGSGLAGGGTLESNRNISLNSASIASLAKADSAVQSVNGVSPTGGNVNVSAEDVRLQDTRTTAIAESFPVNVQFVETAGYSSVGDGGGALYKRVASEPSNAGKFQSADGGWWSLCSWPINVRMFGAKGDGSNDDTQSFKDSYQYLQNGTDYHGGTVHIPRGNYIIKDELIFVGFNSSTNLWFVGDGVLNTTLDFSQSPSGKNGIIFRGSGQCGLSKFMVTGAKMHGIVLNDNKDSFLQFVDLSDIRVQQCVGDGIYSENAWNITLKNIWSRDNGGNGINFVGNHTSIVGDKVFCSTNGANGHRINGAIYIKYNGQSDHNIFHGYDLSNIRGASFIALGSEYNGRSAVRIRTGVDTDGITQEYQGFSGVTFENMFSLYNSNNVEGDNSFLVVSSGGVPARFTVIGLEEDVTAGDTSCTFDANAGGTITVNYIDTVLKSGTVKAGSVKINDWYELFP